MYIIAQHGTYFLLCRLKYKPCDRVSIPAFIPGSVRMVAKNYCTVPTAWYQVNISFGYLK
jgi:hypothetical protein